MRRRTFLKQTGLSAFLLGLGNRYARAFSPFDLSPVRLRILHTNDLNGSFSPPTNNPLPTSLQNLIQKIQTETTHPLLLLDAGNHFGAASPTMNYTLQVMNALQYDAACMGNDDMKMGFYPLLKQYTHVNFPILSSNYTLNNTALQTCTTSYTVVQRADIKIGIFALNKPYNPLHTSDLNPSIDTVDALATARQLTDLLRNQEACQLIICLSQLGLTSQNDGVSDVEVAKQVPGIDIILGGGSRTFMSEAIEIQNINNKKVILSQAGHDGILLGQLDIEIQPYQGVQLLQSRYLNTKSSPFY